MINLFYLIYLLYFLNIISKVTTIVSKNQEEICGKFEIHKQQRIDSINSVLLRIEEGQKVGSFNECLERCCNITKCSAITFTGFLTKTSDLNSTNPSKCLLFSCINKSSFNIDGRCQFNKGTNEEINIGLLSVEILRETLNNESNLNEGNKINEKDLQLNGEIDYKIKQIRYEERNHSVLNLSTWDEMFPLDPQHIPVWIIGLAIVVSVVGFGILLGLFVSFLFYKSYRSRMRSAEFSRKKIQMLHAFNPPP
ncbi:hypothetical protein ACQ4LE_009942 [Meloidogyne hapla]